MLFSTCWGGGKAQQEAKERCAKGSFALSTECLYTCVVCLEILTRENLFDGKKADWDQITPSNSPRSRGTKWNFGKKAPSRGIIQKCEPHERSPCALEFEESSQEETTPRKMRPQSSTGLGENILKLKIAEKASFCSPLGIKAAPAHISKPPEEREFVVDSGASNAHAEQKRLKLRRIGYFAKIQQPNCSTCSEWWSVCKRGGAQVFVHDLNLFVTLQLLEETLAVLSLGKFCEDHGCSCEWVSGQKPRLTREGRTLDVLLFQGCHPVLVPVRLLHRHCRTRQVHLQVQQQSDVTEWHTEIGAIPQQPNIRTTSCEIFLKGWRGSQTI